MKRILILIFILSGLAGCTAHKKASRETDESKTNVTTKTEINTSASNDSSLTDKTKTVVSSVSEKETETTKKENTVTKNVTTNFDTSKPVNPTTGKPPVASISETTSENISNTQTSEALKNSLRTEIENNIRKEYENKYDETISGYQTMVEKLNIKLAQKEKPVEKWKLILVGAGIPVFFYLVFWIRKKLLSFGYLR